MATSLSRLALELEESTALVPSLGGSKQRTYDLIQEASKLLPLFQQHTEAQFMGSCPPAQTGGFRSLPTDVQHAILCLAGTDKATARQLRRVCRAFAAHACLTERSRTSLDVSSAADACRLPYLPRLRSIECAQYHGTRALNCFVNSILSTQLAAWPALTSLRLSGKLNAHVLNRLQLAPQLLQLHVDSLLSDDGPCPLHYVWQLTRLRALSLDAFPLDSSTFQHLSQLQLLTRLQYSVPTEGDTLQLGFAKAVGSLSGLRELELIGWLCKDDRTHHAPWRALMQSIGTLTHLTLLQFEQLDLQPSTSATYLPALASTLRSLPSLSHLKLHGLLSGESGHVDSAGFGAGCALVAAIATLTQLHSLTLRGLEAVDVRHCCRHLASLVQLQHLALRCLSVRESTAGALQADVPPAGQADESSFAHLLACMTRLQTLTLLGVDFSRDAMRVFSDVLPTLADLRTLNVWAVEIGPEPMAALAHSCLQLPNLRVLCGDDGSDNEGGFMPMFFDILNSLK